MNYPAPVRPSRTCGMSTTILPFLCAYLEYARQGEHWMYRRTVSYDLIPWC